MQKFLHVYGQVLYVEQKKQHNLSNKKEFLLKAKNKVSFIYIKTTLFIIFIIFFLIFIISINLLLFLLKNLNINISSLCIYIYIYIDGYDYEWVQLRPRHWFHLDELFAGSCDGMTYEEIEEKFPGLI